MKSKHGGARMGAGRHKQLSRELKQGRTYPIQIRMQNARNLPKSPDERNRYFGHIIEKFFREDGERKLEEYRRFREIKIVNVRLSPNLSDRIDKATFRRSELIDFILERDMNGS